MRSWRRSESAGWALLRRGTLDLVAERSSDLESRSPLAVSEIQVGTEIEECARHGPPLAATGLHERRLPLRVPRVDGGAFGTQETHDLELAFAGGPHEGRRSVVGACIHLRAAHDEDSQRRHPPAHPAFSTALAPP